MKKTSLTSPLRPSTDYQNVPAKSNFCSPNPDWHDMSDREIITNIPDIKLPNNKIHTSKYNCLTFIPKNLIEQFTKLANVYFLIIACLQTIKEISTSNGVPVTLFPLTFIVIITAIKDIYEDLMRHRSDHEENSRKVLVLRDGEFCHTSWENLLVGDIIKIQENEYFPADVLILRTSEVKGQCFIETKNLDGETNLKHKKAHKDLSTDFNSKSLWELRDHFSYERPNPFLYTFTGTYHNDNFKIPMNSNNFILRGCSLRNSKFVIGIIAYTGHDTKIMLNSTKARAKRSKVEMLMNKLIITVFLFQILFCVFCGFYNAIWYSNNQNKLSYLEIDLNGTKDNAFYYNLFVRMGNWLIIFQNFVPISLIVTLEMVKLFQGVFISKDKKMIFHEKVENIPVTVQTSSLNEELGQVEYIFSDKTGTLTCNIMDFKKVCIDGVSYGEDYSLSNEQIEQMPNVTNVDFRDINFFNILNEQNNIEVNEMLLSIALCHTILAEIKPNGELVYNATSPDELALVNWARFCGVEFRGIDENNCMIVDFRGKNFVYELLHVLEFTSSRKRQSVILKNPINGEIILYSKGADTIIEKRLRKEQENLRQITWDHLERYASSGLRTLLVAKRTIEEDEYKRWAKKYLDACSSIHDRERNMEDCQEEIEVDLEIIGATAIEDKLQDEVGETITALKQAGINLWVLTGDKIETAINIGYSCKLIDDKQEKIIISGSTSDKIEQELAEGKEKINDKYALIVTGEALILCSKSPFDKKLLDLAEKSEAVIACRVSPKQKQEIVSLVRNNKPKITTLAIGDGANDVNMITAAHVGIGIKGLEGQQAARASDYSIGEFKVLRRLVLFYGRESYRKNSNLICYNFFKNMVLVLPQFWFGFFNGFSGQSLYNPYLFQLYNIIYASLPIVIYAILDKEGKGSYFISNPREYFQGPQNLLFNVKVFWMWIAFGVWQSCILLFFTYYSIGDNFVSPNHGYTMDFWGAGMAVFGFLIAVTNFKVLIMASRHSFLGAVTIAITVFASILAYIITYGISSAVFCTFDDYETFRQSFSSANFYWILILLIIATSIFDMGYERFLSIFSDEPKKEQKAYKIVDESSSSPGQEEIEMNEKGLKKDIYHKPTKMSKAMTRKCTIKLISSIIILLDTGFAYSQEDSSKNDYDYKKTISN